ncbi:NgoFVII family restriction endonuclease [Candidatus Saccharibacteria bacterium]|nr:NgoFVII family restriction endonuclease [Candidatus Saccharibacteria bacterium]
MFLDNQHPNQKEAYFNALRALGSLSRLFSNNQIPYLHYRSHENVFAKTLGAENHSRADLAVDAVKDAIGIGLKTFIYRISQYEKIAEFNKCLPEYKDLGNMELVRYIARARNERIRLAARTYGLKSNLYHCVARKEGCFLIYEVSMAEINPDSIHGIKKERDNTISFREGDIEYKFNCSKSTLYKRFSPTKASAQIPIDILRDPYQTILGLLPLDLRYPENTPPSRTIILPLFSPRRGGNIVHDKSGLNQWNAGGRSRHEDEVYIPVPKWIHRAFENFFPPRHVSFNLFLPGGKKLRVAVCQAGDKALMSNPNKALGEWLLRRVLSLKRGELLTYSKLLRIGVDSVAITKDSVGRYHIDFKASGTYDAFARANSSQYIIDEDREHL